MKVKRRFLACLILNIILFNSLSLLCYAYDDQNNDITYGKLYYEQYGILKYEGQLKDGKPHGMGKGYDWHSDRGAVLSYEGEYKNGLPDGYGKSYDIYGNLNYIGQYKNGKEHGYGINIYNGLIDYIGEHKNGRRDGWGIEYLHSQFEYECIRINNKKSMLLTKDRNKVLDPIPTDFSIIKIKLNENEAKEVYGEVVNEDKLLQILENRSNHPKDIVKLTLSSLKYEGETQNNLRNGYGKLYNKDGEIIYAGSWKNDSINGFGVTFFNNLASYIGGFKNNTHEGLGVYASGDLGNEVFTEIQDGVSKTTTIHGMHKSKYVTKVPLPFPKIEWDKNKQSYYGNFTNGKITIVDLNEKELKKIIREYDNLYDDFKSYFEKFKKKESERFIPSA
ncbi:MORN repeat-containing protein [Lutispora thermophila]|uniref:MORN repeat-containing protein n=1 Tax=Lutispora thermophila DSM 19022 TaxID=1122184 RepID=A0A1M6HQ42_9FIRM|nr:hypothetical protein [Lutispora thermophila]SHJ24330.1 MORN repeat-containing protein [Lutispora thermophila DSM 19022]